ncbi:HEAT repeat domain-containing protein [Saccharopolyspora sp. NFXS83]|uniref:orotidine 5'-phosphate decarboxylase / HUMPS family protein n=1 Tax=Saccharopolyspora sp. NFXS83 TaxID=2993560 RepID=UPI00224B6498|nr:orotidine 5'-phosphate decarboxylase / HUMPS family protein [Saccharopolyspora sp. NFXS83]MCX2729462.1 HEAT repeat domain-containing protein [Saccharopolyspora sp. NFXS83]
MPVTQDGLEDRDAPEVIGSDQSPRARYSDHSNAVLGGICVTRDLTWSPHEVKVLREVQHLSQRSFAEHLGFAQSTVANWEKATRNGSLHHETQEVLNRALDNLSAEHRERFDRQCSNSPRKLGVGSATRTRHVIDSLSDVASPLPYYAPASTVEAFRSFLSSATRVFLLAGPAGTGKTQLTHHLADQLANDADLQLFAVTEWTDEHVDLASEVLRYASIPPGQDALLTLEKHCAGLSRPCVVIIDGVANDHDVAFIGRQVEAILRQVTTSHLRFLIAIRTPLAVETTAYPLVHANIYTPTKSPSARYSVELARWTPAEARSLWDQARTEQTTPYDQLPRGIQNLVLTPVYLRLALTASLQTPKGDLNLYALLDQCVRTIIGNSDAVAVMSLLTDHAYLQYREELPATMPEATPGLTHVNATRHAVLLADVTRNIACECNGRFEFTHDILREFFVSTAISDYLHAQGRCLASVRTLNDLAKRAVTSGIARNIIELVFQRLDNIAPDLLGYVATAPATAVETTLPLLMAAADGSRFAAPELLRQVVLRAERESSLDLCRSLLHVRSVATALGSELAAWLVALLRHFETSLWPDITRFVEHTFGIAESRDLVDATDLTVGDEAIFIARHFYLFAIATDILQLDAFLGHSNWRVRAALAEGISDDRAPLDVSTHNVLEQLAHDPDYKVRSAAARAATRLTGTTAQRHVATLLHDDNWHVRELVLRSLDHRAAHCPDDALVHTAVAAADPSWQHCPQHVRPSWHRLHILLGTGTGPGRNDDPRALLTILREIRTGYLELSTTRVRDIAHRAQRSDHWLVRQEADHLITEIHQQRTSENSLRNHERFRRTRDTRAVQIALDVHDVDQAIGIAQAAVKAGADFVEIGDPLIKEAGVSAIEQVKTAVPDATIVAEMMSADWGRDQVLLAAEAGADIVLLIGPATKASVSAAVDAGQRLGIPILLDAPTNTTRQWVTDMERAGVDGFAITTNIDVGIGSATAFETAQTLRSWTRLPVAVSGGFSVADHTQLATADWDILIVGRSVTDAVDPTTAAAHIVELAHQTGRHA